MNLLAFDHAAKISHISLDFAVSKISSSCLTCETSGFVVIFPDLWDLPTHLSTAHFSSVYHYYLCSWGIICCYGGGGQVIVDKVNHRCGWISLILHSGSYSFPWWCFRLVFLIHQQLSRWISKPLVFLSTKFQTNLESADKNLKFWWYWKELWRTANKSRPKSHSVTSGIGSAPRRL